MPRPIINAAALRRIMQQELQVGKRLVALADEMTQATIGRQVARIATLEEEQRELAALQITLDGLRGTVMRDIAQALGREQPPTLLALLPLLSLRDRNTLGQIRAQILETQERLTQSNQRNRLLLETALDCTRFNLEAITSAVLQPAPYGTNLASLDAPTFYVDSKV